MYLPITECPACGSDLLKVRGEPMCVDPDCQLYLTHMTEENTSGLP